ncbi:hypothetical protein K8W59_00110 [Nocardioides rotundus]|uniref:FlgD immunoglobulin-like domain containing protein n=1 Tax=Nocardioides rotundus TaxID=1774216 RepID=UPI001CBAE23C|nr:FlgD immunoglobulin-like domain containing protein [Nocardioides rotundus]UAL30008.1 hypothetical protein K8W59_00110 [Nocardioides rotundus]
MAIAITTLGLSSPALAYSPIDVYSPSGEQFSSGASVIVEGFNEGDPSEIETYCDSGGWSGGFAVPTGNFTVNLGSFEGPEWCEIRDRNTGDRLATFSVAAPEPVMTVSNASVNVAKFYPLVRDGYRDSVRFSWRQDGDERPTIEVVNADGVSVRTLRPWAWAGRNDWTWNGKNDNGNFVAKGSYRIRVDGGSNVATARVTLTSEIVTRTFTKRKEGNQASSFRTRGNCYGQRDSYYEIAYLDCWGGRFARANYGISIPANAFDLTGRVDLLQSDLDLCCRGRITKGWKRSSSRRVSFWAMVTNWRATEVNFVRVTYKARVRI